MRNNQCSFGESQIAIKLIEHLAFNIRAKHASAKWNCSETPGSKIARKHLTIQHSITGNWFD